MILISEVIIMKKNILIAFVLSAAIVAGSFSTFSNGFVFADENDETYDEPIEELIPDSTDDSAGDDEIASIEECIDDYDASVVAINAINFPDANFRNYVSENFDTNYDGNLDFYERLVVGDIGVSGMNIYSLTGIEYFTYLQSLSCKMNYLTELDVSSNTELRVLMCDNNLLSSIDVSHNTKLELISCTYNLLTNLDVSNNTVLEDLYCNENQLTRLNVSNNRALEVLICDNNRLTSLNVNNSPALRWLECYKNQITRLDISSCNILINLYKTCEHTITDNIVNISYWPDPDNIFTYQELSYDYGTSIISEEEPPAPAGSVNMYRLYNPNSGEHFYTANAGERNHLISLGWNDEGIGWVAPASSNTPVYRLYNQNGGEHHYTTSIAERDHLVSLGWNDEGIGWYSDDQERVPLYRQYNPNAFANNHNYTTSLSENNWLVSIGWQAEGIGWYGTGTGG